MVTDTEIKNYKADIEASEVERGVEFLDWLAINCPRRAVPLTYIMKAACAKNKVPREDGEEVKFFKRRKLPRIRRLLWKKHARMLKHVFNFGYRPSADWSDLILNYCPFKKTFTSIRNVQEVMDRTPREKLDKEAKARYDQWEKDVKVLKPIVEGHYLPTTPKGKKK
jgi:hypothetical protein